MEMTSAAEHYSRLQKLFEAVVELPPEARAAALEAHCGDDAALRQEVDALLAADAQNTSFGEQPLALPHDLFSREHTDQIVGRRFGVYEVIREIGRGGLGVVYLAARADDEYRKEVAIKLIRRGLDTDDILRRFLTERQILAQLDHPNIARLLDGGTTEDGLPYFVMEHVKGEPINAYCEAHGLKLSERLELFRKVCGAVTFAHQNLVVHRDLKPSNILVTPEGEPKLLDFGIAKLLSADDEMLTQTAPGERALTPQYASPEQLRGEKITTVSDVYSLGVLLYELLTGQRPYRLQTGGADEIARAITEQEPERPSTALTNNEYPQASVLDPRSLRGDLDRIVLMAIRKEPERRYSSVENLSDDIRRHQQRLPVRARPNTFSYRARKFISRNKTTAVAAALILAAIVAGTIATQRQAQIAHAQRLKAENRFNDVRKLANSNLFEVYPEIENLEGSLKAREAILRNALAYLDSLAKEAAGDSKLQSELATAYEKVGDVQGALNTSSLGKVSAGLESYAKAGKLRAAVLAEDPKSIEAKESLANNYYVTARTLWNNSQTTEAEEAFERSLKLRRELVAARPDTVQFKNRLAVLLIDYGAIPMFNFQTAKAVVLFDEALGIIGKLRQQDPGNSEFKKTHARGLRIQSKAKGAAGDYAGGLAALDEAMSLATELAKEFPKDFRTQRSVWLTETMRCELFVDKSAGTEAVASCLKTIDFPKTALEHEPENGVVAFDLAISHFNTARAFGLAGQHEQTIEHANSAVEVMSKLSQKSPDNAEYKRNLAIYRTSLARSQIELGRFDEALSVARDVQELLTKVIEADPKSTTYKYDLSLAYRLSARAFHKKGDSARAREDIQKALDILAALKEQKSLRESDSEVVAEVEQEKAEYAR